MSWASALKSLISKSRYQRRKQIELIQNDEFYKFFECGLRGGMTFINKHYVETSDGSGLLYIDFNNI